MFSEDAILVSVAWIIYNILCMCKSKCGGLYKSKKAVNVNKSLIGPENVKENLQNKITRTHHKKNKISLSKVLLITTFNI